MRIIITGGSGLIGRQLSSTLASDKHEVIVLSRNPAKVKDLPDGVRVEQWDGKSAAGWGELADGAGAIINLAGEGIADGRWSSERKQSIRESRIHAGLAVVEAIKQATTKPGVLIQASAVGYYGPCQDEVITEESPMGDDFLAKVCHDWEASSVAVSKLGVRRPVLRTGVVLSNQGGAFPKIVMPFKLFAGGPIGSGKQWLPWIHIEDQVRAIQFLIEQENANGPFNLCAPNPVTNKEFGNLLGHAMGRPALLPTPAFALKALFGEMSTVLLSGQRAVPKHLQELGFTFKFPTLEAALTDLVKEKVEAGVTTNS
ncbi:TIGR01777 family oxidoreductase [soil metagenome]